MRVELSEQSFNLVKSILSYTYVELNIQKERDELLPLRKRHVCDTAELVKTALNEIGVKVLPTKIDLDKEGNLK